MTEVKIKYGVPSTISISINNLTALNRNFSDITDILFMLKNKASDADSLALISKKYKTVTGITLDQNNKKIFVSLLKSDFGPSKMETNGNYLICIGVEFNNDGIYIEDQDEKFERRLKVIPDKIRA